MKRNLWMLVGLVFSINTLTNAQNHELRLGIGDAMPYHIGNMLTSVFTDVLVYNVFSGYNVKNVDYEGFTPSINLAYRYSISPRFKIGADASVISSTKIATYQHRNDYSTFQEKSAMTTFLLFASGEFVYLQKNIFELIGQAGLGAMVLTAQSKSDGYSNSGAAFMFNVYPIGVRVGSKLGGFLLAGFGMEGIVKGGISFRF